jgi:very-short-patch-repair endonuclease
MVRTSVQHPSAEPWKLVERQHGVISRAQLLGLGFSTDAIAHRIATGRLHPVQRGVYAVGRPQLSRHGRWMAAVMSCGEQAVLSHASAAMLWGLRQREGEGVPVTTVHRTLLDLAQILGTDQLEAAINAADKFDLTDSELERRFLPLARRAGLPRPLTGEKLNGFKVDFFWFELGLVVETDGLRYHRTPAQQARDRLRDQAHVAAGMTRFASRTLRCDTSPGTSKPPLPPLRAGSETSDPRLYVPRPTQSCKKR